MKLSITALTLTRADYQNVNSKQTTKRGKIASVKMLIFLKLQVSQHVCTSQNPVITLVPDSHLKYFKASRNIVILSK